jgi:DNA-binding CsgD family transcriptional regulator
VRKYRRSTGRADGNGQTAVVLSAKTNQQPPLPSDVQSAPTSRCHLPCREWAVISERLGLTARESEIARLVLDDVSDAQVASRLSISRWTVHAHLARLYLKSDVHSRQQFVVRVFNAYLLLRRCTVDSVLKPDGLTSRD